MITDATGVSKVIMEVAKSSSMRRTGVTALLWYVMRGAPLRLHSKAETVWHLLIDKSIFSLGHKYPEGKGRSKNGGGEENWCFGGMWLRRERGSRTVRICHLIIFLYFCADRQKMLDLVSSLIQSFVVSSISIEMEDLPSKVLSRVLELMLCLLDVPSFSVDMSSILLLYAPVFKLKSSR
ncbi:hypothetical protein B296_00028543 [Ensete ventricosum]|uniref:Uncharacterized protein n=1 Tax=Ensete ventricosum TaxID=4639 RepID=A0A427AMQ1_ENSVE|nr:hypothetical protein B296_00028543 [Ensete ventricosum]